MVALLGFARRDVADSLQQQAIVEPVDPGERRELDGLEASPGPAPVAGFGLVEAVVRLGEGIVVRVSDATDRRLDACCGQTFGVMAADLLRSAIRVVREAAFAGGTQFVQRLLESVRHKAGVRCPAHSPADDAAGVAVDHQGHGDEA